MPTTEHASRPRRWPLVLIVGRDEPARGALARALLEAGSSVLLCAAPWERPAQDVPCPLIRDGRCVLTDRADVAVVLGGPGALRAAAELRLCALSARHVVLPATSQMRRDLAGAFVAKGDDVGALTDAVARAITARP